MSANSNEDDVRCMERLCAGEDLALNELMGRWKQPLVTFCFRYTGNLTDARELAQEAFVNVYKARKRYRPKALFSTWLFSIAMNLCRMRARWRSRHPEVLSERMPGELELEVTGFDPRDETDRNALAADLAGAIANLPHDLRGAFVLFEINGQSYREVSAVLGCSEKAVERRLARAREQLRVVLAQKWRE